MTIIGTDTWPSSRGFGSGGAGAYSWLVDEPGPSGTGITTGRRKRWTIAPSGNSGSGFDLKAAAGDWFGPVTPGQVITASCWMRADVGGKELAMSLEFADRITISGTVIVGALTTGTSVMSDPGVWQRVSVTATVPASGVGIVAVAQVLAGGTVWGVGDTLDATGLLIEVAPAPAGAYFDGSSGSGFVWTGTPNASKSSEHGVWVWTDFAPEVTWQSLTGVGMT